MNTKLFLSIALRIILLFGVPILFTWAPDYYPDSFFNDRTRFIEGYGIEVLDYGVRHIWYNILLGFLFILSLVDAVVFIVNSVNKFYPNLNKS